MFLTFTKIRFDTICKVCLLCSVKRLEDVVTESETRKRCVEISVVCAEIVSQLVVTLPRKSGSVGFGASRTWCGTENMYSFDETLREYTLLTFQKLKKNTM